MIACARTCVAHPLGDSQGLELFDRVAESLVVHALDTFDRQVTVRLLAPSVDFLEDGV